MAKTDEKTIAQLIALVEKRNIGKITITENGVTISVAKGDATPHMMQHASVQNETPAPQNIQPESKKIITSKYIGIFCSAKGIAIGSVFKKGDVLGSVKAMRIANDIVADCDGCISKMSVENNAPVEYGQALFEY